MATLKTEVLPPKQIKELPGSHFHKNSDLNYTRRVAQCYYIALLFHTAERLHILYGFYLM